MSKYKLLKDITFCNQGRIFYKSEIDFGDQKRIIYITEDKPTVSIFEDEIDNIEDYFQEIKEPETVFTISTINEKTQELLRAGCSKSSLESLKNLGLLFETREEAEKYLEYLRAKTVIEQDVKGIEIDWENLDISKYYGAWNIEDNEFFIRSTVSLRELTFYFNSREEVEESYKKHPEEWKTYLTYCW